MALPDNTLSSISTPAAFLPPDNIAWNFVEDWERGGIAISDPSAGLLYQNWKAYLVGNSIVVKGMTTNVETLVLTDPGITSLSLAFDQNMRPTIAYMVGLTAKLYWYDTVLGSNTTVTLDAGVSSPRVCMDDKRPSQTAANDVLLVYFRAGNIYYRQQRDRFLTERLLAPTGGASHIRRIGMGASLRLQIETSAVTEESVVETPLASTAYTDLLTDEVYIALGSEVKPFISTGNRIGVWRSKKFSMRDFPSFAWARVNGQLTDPVTLRLYADGVLWYTTPPIITRDPVRLPVGRHKYMEIEVESKGQISSLTLATHSQELLL